MEYQAKELFAKHGVTTTVGVVVETAEAARAAADDAAGALPDALAAYDAGDIVVFSVDDALC